MLGPVCQGAVPSPPGSPIAAPLKRKTPCDQPLLSVPWDLGAALPSGTHVVLFLECPRETSDFSDRHLPFLRPQMGQQVDCKAACDDGYDQF